jgi:autotransporter-associated beta strand protein
MKNKHSYSILIIFTCFNMGINTFAQVSIQKFWALNQNPVFVWDNTPNNNQVDNGSGNWDLTTNNWCRYNGTQNFTWQPCYKAQFGGNAGVGNAGTVTLQAPVTVASIDFKPAAGGNFTITGQSMTSCLNTLLINVAASLSPTISSVITGSYSIVKTGDGVITLNGNNSYTGTMTINAGTVIESAGTDHPVIINSNGTYKLAKNSAGGYTATTLTINGAGVAAITGFYINGGNRYSCGYNNLILQTAPTTIRQYGTGYASIGNFDINGNGMTVQAAASGSQSDANIQYISYGYGMSFYVYAGASTATGDFTINGPLNISGNPYCLYQRGTGSIKYNATALSGHSGPFNFQGGTALCGANNIYYVNSTNGNYLNQSAGTYLRLLGTSQTFRYLTGTGNITGSVATASTLTIATASGDNTTYSGLIGGTGTNDNNLALVVNGSGIQTLSGVNTYTGGTTINTGAITCGSATALGTGTITVNAGGILNKNGFTLANAIVNNGGTVNP